MTPYFMVNEETLERTPPEVRQYLRILRQRITELESTDPQRRIEQLEGTIRGLHAEIDDLKAVVHQQQQQIDPLRSDPRFIGLLLRMNVTKEGGKVGQVSETEPDAAADQGA
jgi:uncharacterized coiled-coil protein SlyX